MLVLSMLHAVWMMALFLFYLSFSFTLDDEVMLIRLTSAFKNTLIEQDYKELRDRFLFVCVSWEKQLIEKIDTASGMPIGYIDITNRESLGRFLQMLNQKPDNHKYLIVDVRFYDPAPNDSLLAAELKRIQHCRVSYHKTENDKPHYPIFQAPLGLSDMQSTNEMVLKYHLIQGDSLKTTPLLMYEDLYGLKHEKGLLYDKIGGNYVFNTYILDHPIRNFLRFRNLQYNYSYMSDMLMLPPEFFHEMTKDKIIVVGDFENLDIHQTIYGPMPGPLILVNAFLSLEKGYNQLKIGFLFMLFIAFTLVSYKALTLNDTIIDFIIKIIKKIFNTIQRILIKMKILKESVEMEGNKSAVTEFLADSLFYTIYFGVVSVISYYFYNIHITILILAFYMWAFEAFIQYLSDRVEQNKARVNI
ncbi:MAG: hypothetical protein OHK0038_04700 [Flammeovirgaceae bacterium]